MKKILSLFLCFLTIFFCAGCNKEKNPPGEIYSLEEAYENGWITREHLLSIAYYFGGQKENNVELQDENYAPIPKNPEKLSEKTALKIRKTDLYRMREVGKSKFDLSDMLIEGYYGCYMDYYAVTTSFKGARYTEDIKDRMIDGVLFTYTYEFPVLWKEK